jgi:exopolysaccharide/PEP-CTERM locus tyrosine autokinase
MTEHVPGLIQRAAARLQEAPSPSLRPVAPAAAPVPPRQDAPAPLGPARAVPGRQVTLSPTSLAAHGIVLPSSGFSRPVEEFRALKRHVISNAMRVGNAQNRIVLVTSARPGEGKTFTSISLALSLAYERDTRVLLVDADAYRQSLMNYLGLSSDTGWLDTVADETRSLTDLELATNVPGLTILPSGKQRAEIPELMSSRQMKTALQELAREDAERFIIIDALPCLTSTEPSILAALAGQTLFVVAAHQTSREDVEVALRHLNTSPSVNLVLNKAEPLLSDQFKGYGYAYQR